MNIYKVSFKSEGSDSRHKRIIKSPVKLLYNSQLNSLLNWEFFRWTETSWEIVDVTLKKIDEETYSFLRKNKKTIWLILWEDWNVETREVL